MYYLVILSLLISLAASIYVRVMFHKYSKQPNDRGITGAEAAQQMLQEMGIYNVQVEQIHGKLNDHYSPATNTIYLSDSVFADTSVAAVGVAMHEAGHAVQHAQGYTPVKIRSAIVTTTNISSYGSYILVILGLGLDKMPLLKFGIILFLAVVLFQLITLPVEFNASRRALAAMQESSMLTTDEQHGAAKVLTAAAMTYVAALMTALLHLLRLILIFSSRSNRRRRR